MLSGRIAIYDIFPLIQIGYNHRIIQTPPSLQADVESVFGCLKFKLKFESTIVESRPRSGSVTTAVHRRRDHACTHADSRRAREDLKDHGEGRIGIHTKVEMTPIDECVNLTSWTPSTFKAELFSNQANGISLKPYDRTPTDEIKVSCRGGTLHDHPELLARGL